jgi:phosphoribosylaminoimidazolecarboxamide formyltransferase/IMP cyclohydrolase
MNVKIKKALISVSDKEKIIPLAKFLSKNDIEIISTGGTAKILQENKIETTDISDFTKFPEMMGGRVKTLHPKVHGALLADLENKSHTKAVEEFCIDVIDLLIVNFYPFEKTVASSKDDNEIIENIDIGGPAMVRSAAKNFKNKIVITDNSDYDLLIGHLKKNSFTSALEFRRNQARKAFSLVASYDMAIANYFNQEDDDFYFLRGNLKQKLRYGENSHQQAAVFNNDTEGLTNATQLQGKELSYNNYNDANAAFEIASEFSDPTVAIIKHANPCGVAYDSDIAIAYNKAFSSDKKSAFGGIVAINREVNGDLARKISQIFYEVVIAPKFSNEAKEILQKKKNLRLLEFSFKRNFQKEIKTISGGFLMQNCDNKRIIISNLKQAGEVGISQDKKSQLVFAMSICKYVKSNAIVVVNDFQTVGVGCGQTSRVDSFEIACKKAEKFEKNSGEIENRCQDSFLASDAFLPFPDNIYIAQKYGIKAIVAPCGSVNDPKVIEAANKASIALYFIDSRHFKH